jgi:hypothetical protein
VDKLPDKDEVVGSNPIGPIAVEGGETPENQREKQPPDAEASSGGCCALAGETRQTDSLRSVGASVGGKPVYTYFIQAVTGGPIKIGKTTDPKGRLKTMQTAIPQQLAVIGLLIGDHEASLHEKFAGFRLSGEWFKDGGYLVRFMCRHFGKDCFSRLKGASPFLPRGSRNGVPIPEPVERRYFNINRVRPNKR